VQSTVTAQNPPDRKIQRAAFDEIFLVSGVDCTHGIKRQIISGGE
jgi:hypothetical protein